MTAKIRKITRRHGDLVATCEKCKKRGGPYHVPWKIEYEAIEGSGRSGPIAYRCKRHKPH